MLSEHAFAFLLLRGGMAIPRVVASNSQLAHAHPIAAPFAGQMSGCVLTVPI